MRLRAAAAAQHNTLLGPYADHIVRGVDFVMDHVAGLPITRFCDENKLSIEDRLSLFLQVCDAIMHAHQKAVT